MITVNGIPVERTKFRMNNITDEIEQWAKEACDRIFSHYTKEEMELMRKQNGNK